MTASAGGRLVGKGRFPSPGSLVAKGLGCKCPSGVNDMGRGHKELAKTHMGRRWVYDFECPFHKIHADQRCAGVEDEERWLILVPLEEG